MKADEFFAAEAERCLRAYEAGHFASLLELAVLCVENERPLPLWAGRQLISIAQDAYERRKIGKGRGRANSFKWTAAEAKKKWMQWDCARLCRWQLEEQQSKLKSLSRAERAKLGKDKLLLDGEFPLNTEGAYQLASKRLKGTPYQGEPARIKKNYQAVEEARKTGQDIFLKAADGALE